MAKRRPPTVHGLAVVDKPAGVTSHDVVNLLRRRFGERRIGHAGTLDPDATGVLLVGVGTVTRLLRFLTELGKTYTGEVVLGRETSTLDAAGETTATHDMAGVTIDDARRVVVEHLTGDILQIPPMVSAVRVDGRRLHELAREGIEIERAPRPVTISHFTVDPTDDPLVLPDRGDVLVGHVRPDARRRSRTVARRRRPSPETATHRVGELHRGGGGAPRDLRAAPALGGVARPHPGRRRRCDGRIGASRAGASCLRRLATVGAARSTRPAAGALRRVPERRGEAGGRAQRWAGGIASTGVDVINDLSSSPWPGERAVITIGAYDGVHLGHQAVIADVRRHAAELDAKSVVLTFDRHPATVVRPESAPRLLTDLPQKLELLATDRHRRHGRRRLRPAPLAREPR